MNRFQREKASSTSDKDETAKTVEVTGKLHGILGITSGSSSSIRKLLGRDLSRFRCLLSLEGL